MNFSCFSLLAIWTYKSCFRIQKSRR